MPAQQSPQQISVPLQSAAGRRMLLEQALGHRWAHILSRRLRRDRSLISHVVAGRRRNSTIEAAIARAVRRDPNDLFETRAA